jgi:hypothetical protein
MVHIVKFIRSAKDLTFSDCRGTFVAAPKGIESPPSLIEENPISRFPVHFQNLRRHLLQPSILA